MNRNFTVANIKLRSRARESLSCCARILDTKYVVILVRDIRPESVLCATGEDNFRASLKRCSSVRYEDQVFWPLFLGVRDSHSLSVASSFFACLPLVIERLAHRLDSNLEVGTAYCQHLMLSQRLTVPASLAPPCDFRVHDDSVTMLKSIGNKVLKWIQS